MYQEYVSKLREQKKNKDLFIFGIGHIGASASSVLNIGHFSSCICEAQLATKLEVLRRELKSLKASEFILSFAGHSYGAKACIEVVRCLLAEEFVSENRSLSVDLSFAHEISLSFNKFVGLAPTVLKIGRSPHGKRLSRIGESPLFFMLLLQLVNFVVFFTLFLQPKTVMFFYGKVRGKAFDDNFLVHGCELLNRGIVEFCFRMGFEEMKLIQEVDKRVLEKFADVIILSVEGDCWVGEENEREVREIVETQLKGKFINLPHRIKHAFVLSSESNAILAQQTTTYL